MSSTYYVLCLSHDPATTAGECRTPEEAAVRIRTGIAGHPACDFLIGRVSGGLVEVGCPPARHQTANLRCCHSCTEWIDVDWLRLLSAAYQTEDAAIQAAVSKIRRRCWTRERLQRLRDQLATA